MSSPPQVVGPPSCIRVALASQSTAHPRRRGRGGESSMPAGPASKQVEDKPTPAYHSSLVHALQIRQARGHQREGRANLLLRRRSSLVQSNKEAELMELRPNLRRVAEMGELGRDTPRHGVVVYNKCMVLQRKKLCGRTRGPREVENRPLGSPGNGQTA
jgi:hypothetical protein